MEGSIFFFCFSIIKNRDTRAKSEILGVSGMTIWLIFKVTMLVNEIALLKKVIYNF